MAPDAFAKQLKQSRQIKISVIGRNTGKTTTRPVFPAGAPRRRGRFQNQEDS